MNEDELKAHIEEFLEFIRNDAAQGDEKLRQTLLLFAEDIERTATQRAHSTVSAILEVIDRRKQFGSRDVWKLYDSRATDAATAAQRQKKASRVAAPDARPNIQQPD